jgi:hypothetical protein
MSRPGPADDDRSLRSEDVDTIRGLFASGAADWALFGYVTPDDARCKLALLRTGTVRRDGPVEANLDPQAIIFGIFRVKVDTGESREEEFPGNSSSIEAKPGSDLRNAGDTEAPLVSFGFFGEHFITLTASLDILWGEGCSCACLPANAQARRPASPHEQSGCPIASSTKHNSRGTAGICNWIDSVLLIVVLVLGHSAQGRTWSCENRRNLTLGRSCVAWRSDGTLSRENHHRNSVQLLVCTMCRAHSSHLMSRFRVDTRCDLSDPSLRHVFESIHSEAELTNWMLCGYVTVWFVEFDVQLLLANRAVLGAPGEQAGSRC